MNTAPDHPRPDAVAATDELPDTAGITSILVIAGEVSGDMHAAQVVAAIRAQRPGIEVFGIGGPRLREAGAETLYDIEDMAVMGFTEVARRFSFFRRVFNELLDIARERKPDLVLLVDYPGFNMRFAARAHAMGLKTVYYICPQVWAWNRARIPRMARIIDRLITIFPFESDCFEGTGLRVDFAGHPLVDEAREALQSAPVTLPCRGTRRVALLPGSRPHEIRRILPVMWDAAMAVQQRHPDASFTIAAPSPEAEAVVQHCLKGLAGGPERWAVVTGQTRQVLRQSRAAMVASGTATIETSLMLCPMIITYRVARMTYWLGKCLVRVPHIGMVNIVAGKRVCPEFVQHEADPAAMAAALAPLLQDGPERAMMVAELHRVNRSLGPGNSARRAAGFVLEELG